MTEIYCMPCGMMRISGVPYSVEVVKKRFHELTSSHIDTLLWEHETVKQGDSEHPQLPADQPVPSTDDDGKHL